MADEDPKRQWLIKSREGLWWRPDSQGYTANLYHAGLYTTSDVKKYSSASYADRRDTFHHISELYDEISSMYDHAESLYRALVNSPDEPPELKNDREVGGR